MKNTESLKCPYLKKCGGCTSIGTPYEETLAKKEKQVAKLLKPYVRLSGIVGMEDPYHYRNKIHRVCAYERMGRNEKHLTGIYAEGTHQVIPVKSCLIEDARAQAVFDDIMQLCRSFKIRAYNEDTGVGLLRHILIRTAHKTGQMMVVLVLTSPVMPGKKNFVKALTAQHPEITTLVLNVNARETSMVLGERESVLYGPGFIEDELCGKRFRISASSFYQINSVQTERLYAKAAEYAALEGRETVLDAYCGIGTIGLSVADRAKAVIGVESNRSAVRDAVSNAKRNGVKNAVWVNEDATLYLMKMASEKAKIDVLLMDPPRSGSTEDFAAAACAVGPKRIVYISCNPETLARDLGWFKSRGYKAKDAEAYDMFPFTDSVETVVLLEKK